MKTCYNFIKKHESLKGNIPAEQAMIKVDGKNKWITLIQNTLLNKENSGQNLHFSPYHNNFTEHYIETILNHKERYYI